MNTIGIDFSITSTAVCACVYGEYRIASFQRRDPTKPFSKPQQAFFDYLGNECDVDMIYIERAPLPKGYMEKERAKLTDIDLISIAVTHWITKQLLGSSGDGPYVALEGMSYASAGSGLDIAEYHSGVKSTLNRELLRTVEDLWVVPPMTLKKFATGKGNAQKDQMIESFMTTEFEHVLWNNLKADSRKFQNKNGRWQKPLDDIVDAVHLVRFMELARYVEENGAA